MEKIGRLVLAFLNGRVHVFVWIDWCLVEVDSDQGRHVMLSVRYLPATFVDLLSS